MLVAKVIVFLATVTKQQTILNGSTSEIDQDILKNNHTKYDPFSSMWTIQAIFGTHRLDYYKWQYNWQNTVIEEKYASEQSKRANK